MYCSSKIKLALSSSGKCLSDIWASVHLQLCTRKDPQPERTLYVLFLSASSQWPQWMKTFQHQGDQIVLKSHIQRGVWGLRAFMQTATQFSFTPIVHITLLTNSEGHWLSTIASLLLRTECQHSLKQNLG